MYIRYKSDEKNKPVPVCRIYTNEEHKIDKTMVDADAIAAIKRLKARGYEAYIVGGAVRDILLGNIPKDFDISTSASPRQVQRLFNNARIIGKRFRLVHLMYPGKVFEVSTFRSEDENGNSNNIFGTVDTDAKRRDFSINSLYYDPIDEKIFDFNNSLTDFKKKEIKSLLPLDSTFIEDPVRMIRAVKYSVTTGFRIGFRLRRAIKRDSTLLDGVSSSRITEEISKILLSGKSLLILKKLNSYGLLVYMLPCLAFYSRFSGIEKGLKELDEKVEQSKRGLGSSVSLGEAFKFLTQFILIIDESLPSKEARFKDIFRQIKVLINPITPPNAEIESAAIIYLKEQGYPVPKLKKKKRINPNENITNNATKKRKRYRRKKKASVPGLEVNIHPTDPDTPILL